jgi:hypothetical protein
MSGSSEVRAWALATAGVICLSAVTYRVMSAPAIPDLTLPIAKLNAGLETINTGAQQIAPTLTHLQTVADAATGVLRAAQAPISKLSTTEGKLNDAIDLTSHRITDLCPDPKAIDAAMHPCGTLADTNRTLATLRGTAGQAERSMIVFNAHEGSLFTQEQAAYGQLNTTVSDIDDTALAIKPLIANGVVITGNAAAITGDGRTWVHQKLYPTKKKGFISSVEATGDVFMHWVPPLF